MRSCGEIFAVSPHCTHYQGPLAEGLVAGPTVRCPWHHARFDLRTGEAVGAPAINAIGCWEIEQRDGLISVGISANGKSRSRTIKLPRNLKRSSSSEAALRDSRRLKCCGEGDTREVS